MKLQYFESANLLLRDGAILLSNFLTELLVRRREIGQGRDMLPNSLPRLRREVLECAGLCTALCSRRDSRKSRDKQGCQQYNAEVNRGFHDRLPQQKRIVFEKQARQNVTFGIACRQCVSEVPSSGRTARLADKCI